MPTMLRCAHRDRKELMKRLLLVAVLALIAASPCAAQKALYLQEIKKAAEKGWRDNPSIMERWRKDTQPSVLWGYNAPGYPIYLAATLAFLYQETGERVYAERTAALLSTYGDLRDALPEGFAGTRVEYEQGVPSLSNFFFRCGTEDHLRDLTFLIAEVILRQ